MPMGIDDALMAAAAGISLTDTCVQTIKAYSKEEVELDIERLIEEVRVTALTRIDEADRALVELERTLVEKGVSLDMILQVSIEAAGFWHPFEAHRLKRIRDSFNALADATYSATDDIAALVRCRDQTGGMKAAVVESSRTKHELHSQLINAESIGEAIGLLRTELVRHKSALMGESS